MQSARAEVSKVLGIMSSVLDDVSDGLRDNDPASIDEALDLIRGTQTGIDDLAAAIKAGHETSLVSPFLWGTRRYINSLARVIPPVDNAVRTTRVLARRARVLADDNDSATPAQIELLDSLSQVCLELSEVYDVNSRVAQATVIPQCVNELRAAGQKAGMDLIPENGVLSAYAILAQTRSLIVDLLQVCGMSRVSAAAVLVPTSTSPNYPPEQYS